jgi:long-chain acyl-CoA synthetase
MLVPAEIEKKMLACPGIDKVAVLALKDALGKPQLAAVITKKNGVDISAQDVSHFSELSLEENERPKSVAFMPELPLNSHGLVDKYRLRFDFGG